MDTMTSLKPSFDFVIEEVGQLDFLLGHSSTLNHKLRNTGAQIKKRLPQTAVNLFSCCSLHWNQLNKTNSFPSCFSKTGLKTTISPVEKSCPKLYNVSKRAEEMSKVAKK